MSNAVPDNLINLEPALVQQIEDDKPDEPVTPVIRPPIKVEIAVEIAVEG